MNNILVRRKYFYILVVTLVSVCFTGCANNQSNSASYSKDIFAMDTYMTVTAYGDNCQEAVEAACSEINRIDSLLSTGNADSEVAGLNEAGSGQLSEDTVFLYEKAREIYEATGGAFDISIYPIMKLWGFTDSNFRVPDDAEIENTLKLVDMSAISFDEKTDTLTFDSEGMAIDFGGIAKGYTSDRIMEIFEEYEVDCGMVSLGGNVETYNLKTDGSKWKIGIQDPDDSDGIIGVLSTVDEAVITSGGYERYFEEDGVTYHHIIDPKTGYPANSGLKSVTIVSGDGTLADGLSTSIYIMGLNKATDFYQTSDYDFEMILLTDDGTLYITEGLEDDFTSDLEINLIEK